MLLRQIFDPYLAQYAYLVGCQRTGEALVIDPLRDIEMRGHWDGFQHAYADCLGATSSHHAPWYVVPADDKRNARLIISHAIVETMKTLKMSCPEPTKARMEELQQVRRLLEQEDKARTSQRAGRPDNPPTP